MLLKIKVHSLYKPVHEYGVNFVITLCNRSNWLIIIDIFTLSNSDYRLHTSVIDCL